MKKIALSVEEATMLRSAMYAWEREARSDEPHYAYTEEFKNLSLKLKDFINKHEAAK
jgi:hypothetical protein